MNFVTFKDKAVALLIIKEKVLVIRTCSLLRKIVCISCLTPMVIVELMVKPKHISLKKEEAILNALILKSYRKIIHH